MTIFQLLRTPLIDEMPFAMTSFLTNGRLFEQRPPRWLLLTQAAQQDCRAPCYMAQFGIGRNWNPTHFMELASGGPFFGLDWQSYPPLPTSYRTTDEGNDF